MRKKFLFFLLITLVGTALLHAQGWERVYGTGMEGGTCVQQTTDGGYVVSGGSALLGPGNNAGWLLRTNSQGDTLWTRTFGGDSTDGFSCVRQTADGGYVITGSTRSSGAGENDLWVVKTDSAGDTLWTRVYGGVQRDGGYWIDQTSDGGYIVTGETYSFLSPDPPATNSLWLLKTDENGDTLWTRIYYGPGLLNGGIGHFVTQTGDDGYIITGLISDTLGPHLWLLKTDAAGDTLWTKRYGAGMPEGRGYEDMGWCVRQLEDGGYVVAGKYAPRHDSSLVWLLRTDQLGDTLWTRTWGADEDYFDVGRSVDVTEDGGFIITGQIAVDLCLIKTDAEGNTEWIRTLGDSLGDGGRCVQQTSDGGYIVTGLKDYIPFTTNSYLWLLKFDSLGFVAVEEPITHPSNSPDLEIAVPIGSQIVIRYSNLPLSSTPGIVIYDALGRKVSEIHNANTSGTVTWGEGQNPGVYFIKPLTGNTPATKVILTR